MSKNWSLGILERVRDTRTCYDQKLTCSDNAEQNI